MVLPFRPRAVAPAAPAAEPTVDVCPACGAGTTTDVYHAHPIPVLALAARVLTVDRCAARCGWSVLR